MWVNTRPKYYKWPLTTILHWVRKGRYVITFWITFGVQFDFLENNSEICDIGSREDQKLTYAQFCEMGI